MPREEPENTDPLARITWKTCLKCKEKKLLFDFPFNYKKSKASEPKLCKYRSRCKDCHHKQLRELYYIRKGKKSLVAEFDGTPEPELQRSESEGAFINVENIEDNNAK
jgi:hypothetical protein